MVQTLEFDDRDVGIARHRQGLANLREVLLRGNLQVLGPHQREDGDLHLAESDGGVVAGEEAIPRTRVDSELGFEALGRLGAGCAPVFRGRLDESSRARRAAP